jgi:Outer membrane protein Omp28/Secretion system C-terminal sorting domain
MKKLIVFLYLIAFVAQPSASVAQYKQVPLVEDFTSWGCAPCADVPPYLDPFLSSRPWIAAVAYHYNVGQPLDTMYMEYRYPQWKRLRYYDIYGIPAAEFNGHEFSPFDTALMSHWIDSMKDLTTPVDLTLTESRESSVLHVHLRLHTARALVGARVMVEVAEEQHHYDSAGTNGEHDFSRVLRTMLPDSNGTQLALNVGDSLDLNWDYLIPEYCIANRLYTIAFVQDDSSRNVLQAATTYPALLAGETVRDGSPPGHEEVLLFPNPADNMCQILLPSSMSQGGAHILLLDLLGRTCFAASTEGGPLNIPLQDLPNGVYSLKIEQSASITYRKGLIIRH